MQPHTNADVTTFIEKVKSENPATDTERRDLNAEFATIKSGLPQDQQAAAETRVREVLKV